MWDFKLQGCTTARLTNLRAGATQTQYATTCLACSSLRDLPRVFHARDRAGLSTMARPKFYAVKVGRGGPKIYTTWDEVRRRRTNDFLI
jgi:hypothetical protein